MQFALIVPKKVQSNEMNGSLHFHHRLMYRNRTLCANFTPNLSGMASGSKVRISDNTDIFSLSETNTKSLIDAGVTIEANNIEVSIATLTCESFVRQC